jgi:hypothetical protein
MTTLAWGLAARAPARAWWIVYGGLVAVTIWFVLTANAEPYDWNAAGVGHDARPYWSAPAEDPYRTSRVGAHDAYLYSPAFLQAIQPLRALPWQAFFSAWTLILLAAGLAIVGPLLLAPVLLLVLPELIGGNVSLLIGLAIVAGFRWPGAWSFILLTKVTPGIGLLWFAVRREWGSLWIALAATATIVLISSVAAPAAWREWFEVLAQNVGSPVTSGSLPVPPLIRIPIALALIVWGARSNRRWVLPIAVVLSLPVIWYGSLSLLVATIPLSGRLRRWSWAAALAILRSMLPSGPRRDPGAGATA